MLLGGGNVLWVLKQEINVSMLYPMNWTILNLCMKLQPIVSGDYTLKMIAKVKTFPNNRCFGWLLGRHVGSPTAPCVNMHAGWHQSGLHRYTVLLFWPFNSQFSLWQHQKPGITIHKVLNRSCNWSSPVATVLPKVHQLLQSQFNSETSYGAICSHPPIWRTFCWRI